MGAYPTINLNDDLPAAPANGVNVKFQAVTSTHDDTIENVSAALVGDGNTAHFLRGDGVYATPPSGSSGSYQFVFASGATLVYSSPGVFAINTDGGTWSLPVGINHGDRLTVVVLASDWTAGSYTYTFNCSDGSNGDGWSVITLTSAAATTAGAMSFELIFSSNGWEILYIEGGSSNI